MRVRLTRKLAECIDGIDLTGRSVGDILEIPDRDAQCLIAEGWASPVRFGRREMARSPAARLPQADPARAAADHPARRPRPAVEPPAASSAAHARDGHGFDQLLADAERLAACALDHERRLVLLVKLIEGNVDGVLAPMPALAGPALPHSLTAASSPAAPGALTDLLAIVRELCTEARDHRQLAEAILLQLAGDVAPAADFPTESAGDDAPRV